MSNSILTIDMITRKALEILENNLVLTRNVNRQYDDSFAVEGAKIGSTLRIRLPDRALVTDGAALQVQDDNEQFTTLTVASQKHIGVNFTSAELTMQLDDFAERVLKPRISQLASSIDADVANAYKTIGNTVGTPGTTPSTSLVLLQAQQKLNENAAVMSPRYATVNPAANAGLVEGMKGLFNPTDTISKQFKNGMMGTGVLGFDEINMSQSIKQHSRSGGNGARGTDRVADALVCVGNVSVDAGGQLADTRLQDTLCEVVQLHGQFGGGEVDANVLLRSHSQGGELFVVVLSLQGGTVGHQSAVGQADTQGRTDFCTVDSKAVIVLAVHVAGDHEVVLQNFQRFARDHVNGKKAVCHD